MKKLKFKPGDTVVVTEVPPRARHLVQVGWHGLIQHVTAEEEVTILENDLGLTKVKIAVGPCVDYTFWWLEKDLELLQVH